MHSIEYRTRHAIRYRGHEIWYGFKINDSINVMFAINSLLLYNIEISLLNIIRVFILWMREFCVEMFEGVFKLNTLTEEVIKQSHHMLPHIIKMWKELSTWTREFLYTSSLVQRTKVKSHCCNCSIPSAKVTGISKSHFIISNMLFHQLFPI